MNYTISAKAGMNQPTPETETLGAVACTDLLGADPKHFVWRMTNGKYVHPECRESYCKKFKEQHSRPSIFSAVSQGYAMSRFTMCEHCKAPIWDSPNVQGQR